MNKGTIRAVKAFTAAVLAVGLAVQPVGMGGILPDFQITASAETTELTKVDGVYIISSVSDLELFRDLVNNGNSFVGETIKLTQDIDLSSSTSWNYGWTPIGTSSASFRGTFDGCGHKITNLYIAPTEEAISYTGLFGYIGKIGVSGEALIKNLAVHGEVHGFRSVGGICGFSFNGKIEKCSFSGSVTSDKVKTLKAYDIGGICGGMEGSGASIKNCYNTATIKSKNSSQNCIGGICGSGHAVNCYNIGKVTDEADNDNGGAITGAVSTASNCYSLVGKGNSGHNVTDATEDQFNFGEVAYLLQSANGSELVWGQDLSSYNNYPILIYTEEDAKYKVYTGYADKECAEKSYANKLLNSDPQHNWSDEWTTNDTHHWHECVNTGCPLTEDDNKDKDGYARHVAGDTEYENITDNAYEEVTYCKTCGKEMKRVSKSGTAPVQCDHEAGEVKKENEKAATCKDEGSYDEVTYCKNCGKEMNRETVTIPKTDEHTKGEVKKENEKAADCTEDGSYDEVVYCTVCGKEISRETKTVKATGHKAGDPVIKNATEEACEKGGSYDEVVYCTVCNKEISRETKTVDAKGHTNGTPVKENNTATCTESGTYDEVVYCTVCGKEISRTQKTADALGHTKGEPKKENITSETCEKGGSYDEVYYCTVCGKELSRETKKVEASGHIAGDWEVTKPATTSEKGEKVKKCKVCGEVLEKSEIEKTVETKYYSVNIDSNVAKADKKTAKQGEKINITAPDSYDTYVYNNGKIIAKFTGNGSFEMPEGNVTVVSKLDARYSFVAAAIRPKSYIYVYDKDMNLVEVFRTKRNAETITVDLSDKYAGKTVALYKGKKSTDEKIEEYTFDENGDITISVDKRTNYTLVIE